MENSKELTALRDHFFKTTGIEAYPHEDCTYPHWKKISLSLTLNCEQLGAIAQYIKDTFSTEGKFTHLIPKLVVEGGNLFLKVDTKQVQEFILKQEVNS